ncbi:MAG: DUF3000 domain-containing protein [Candidatus Nanopelagicales bacterium]
MNPAPASFEAALQSLRTVTYRPEISVEESPAPQRLAPHAVALTAEFIEDDEELASGRLVLLHDPDGNEAWEGDFRVVSFVKAVLEPDLAADPLLTGVAWTWLQEALDGAGSEPRALGGTVTRVMSESFGTIGDRDVTGQVEIRASWTPAGPPEEIGCEAIAWAALLAQAAGLLPLPQGVAVLTPASRSR